MLLAVGLWIALANAAMAGPVGGTTTTTEFGATTTTTTTRPPTTTTTAPPTTTTSTTTTTTIPGELSGQYPFLDKNTADANQSFMDVDTSSTDICVAGVVEEIDPTATPNRSVTFTYNSNGTITKDTDKKVSADFPGSVALTLTIKEVRTPVPPETTVPPEFTQTIELDCKLKASLKQPKGPQSTERAQDRVNLACDLGESFSAFTDLGGDETLIGYIQAAYAKRKNVKADPKNGKLKIKTSGVEVLPGDSVAPDPALEKRCNPPPVPTTTTTTTTTSTTIPT